MAQVMPFKRHNGYITRGSGYMPIGLDVVRSGSSFKEGGALGVLYLYTSAKVDLQQIILGKDFMDMDLVFQGKVVGVGTLGDDDPDSEDGSEDQENVEAEESASEEVCVVPVESSA